MLAEKSLDVPGSHSEKLMGMIETLLEECGFEFEQVDAIAVSEGPGSFTGLRIGASVAKGLAFGRDIPLIAVSTLAALAFGAKSQMQESGLIIAMLDARRMEVYREVFNQHLTSISRLNSEIIDEESFLEFLDTGKVYFVGDAVSKISKVIVHPNAVFLDLEISADYIGVLAHDKYQIGEVADLAYFVPNYLKEFKALQSKKNPLLL